MTSREEKDKKYHADIASVYDYITNEPRAYPNELLFRPIDRLIGRRRLMVDLGCGTGQMLVRYHDRADHLIGVDHSREMMMQAGLKMKALGVDAEFVHSDIFRYINEYPGPAPDLISCVGVLHHLRPEELERLLLQLKAMLADDGLLLIAEPIYSKVPDIISKINQQSILIERLREVMPPQAEDPDEEPLYETALLKAIDNAGLTIQKASKGFELFHQSDPISLAEKMRIRMIYARHREQGDVIALLLSK